MSSSKKLIQASAGNAAGGDFYPYTIDNSARFNAPDSPKLTKTFGTPTNNKKWTYSCWSKLSGPNNTYLSQTLSSGTSVTNYAFITFYPTATGDYFWYQDYNGSNTLALRTLNKKIFRDYSSWYHVVVAVDTTQATSTDRVKVYFNGERYTDWDTSFQIYPAQNYNTKINSNIAHTIGSGTSDYTSSYMSGYLAEPVFVDGQQLPPTDFGEFKNGVWVPKDVSGLTFGNNGFLLDFGNSAALGTDVSGNGNNFTTSGLTSSDQMIDTPTNNFPTMSPLISRTGGATFPTLSEGNLKVNNGNAAMATLAFPTSGKYYAEITVVSVSTQTQIGLDTRFSENVAPYYFNYYYSDGQSVIDNAVVGTVTTYTTNDVIGVAWDADTSEVKWYKNNSLITTQTIGGLGEKEYALTISGAGTPVNTVNFGQTDFTYTPPTGYLALSTANLPEPTIGPNSDIKPDDVFQVELSTGNGLSKASGGKMIFTDVDFTDGGYMVWGKNRDAADSWGCFDTLRGSNKYIILDGNLANTTNTETLEFTSAGCKLGNSHLVNASGEDYVFYMFKVTPGFFDMKQYTSTGSVLNVSHDLGVAPKMVIGNNYSGLYKNWIVQVDGGQVTDPETDYLLLDLNYAAADDATVWNDTAPTDSVVTLGTNANLNSATPYEGILYMFADAEGFCKTGYYKGNGGADGPFQYLNFSPELHIIKQTNAVGGWFTLDTEREPYNPTRTWLYLDTNGSENSANIADLNSNGSKLRFAGGGVNVSSNDYITFSIGTPFKYSNAR